MTDSHRPFITSVRFVGTVVGLCVAAAFLPCPGTQS